MAPVRPEVGVEDREHLGRGRDLPATLQEVGNGRGLAGCHMHRLYCRFHGRLLSEVVAAEDNLITPLI